MYKNYEQLLEMALRENQITLFDLNGREKRFDYQRHVHDYINRLDQISQEDKSAIILQLTIDVWASWEIHIKKSGYALPHFGGVHVENDWLKNKEGNPPCIILSNQPIVQENETPGDLPVQISWKCKEVLGPIEFSSFTFDNCGESCQAWRIYLPNPMIQDHQ